MSTTKKSGVNSAQEYDFPVKRGEYFNFGYDVVDRIAAKDRNKLAMIWVNQRMEERRFTYHDFSKLSNQAANLLIKNGIVKGDRVFVMLPRLPEWWIFSLALIKLGAVQCPSPTLLTPADIAHRIKSGKFKMVITDSENAYKFDEVDDECPSLTLRLVVDGERPGWISYQEAVNGRSSLLSRHAVKYPFKIETKSTDPMILIFTSGTSKFPKMVLHTFDYPLGHLITAKLWHGLKQNDLHFTVSDTGWGKNMWGNYFGQWLLGACVFVYDIRGKFHAEELLPLLEKYEITSFCAPPTVYRMLTLNDLSKFDFSELRQCTTAGEAMQTETMRIWAESTGLKIREGYGQTETVCMIGTFCDREVRPGSMGVAAPGWDIRIHDDNGNDVPDGEDGRIALELTHRPVGLFEKYMYNDAENEKCFVHNFYYTGDRAYRDKDGYFWFVGRADDIIKSSGYRIGPSEVEEVMAKHPSVLEVAVVGAPDPLRGAKVKAYVSLKPGFEPTESLVRELQNFVKRETAPYKYPREIEFINSFPKTFSGKIKRDVLRRHAETGENGWENHKQ